MQSVGRPQGPWAQRLGALASLPRGTWNLPRSETELMSPALAGGFLTSAPPGKSHVLEHHLGPRDLVTELRLYWHLDVFRGLFIA